MHTRSLGLLILISILVLVMQACGSSNQDTQAPIPATQPPTQTPTPTELPTPQAVPVEVQRQEEGGYAYLPPPGYDVSAGMGIVSMLAEGADADLGPSISLYGGPPDPGVSAQSLLDQLKDAEDTQLAEPQLVKIGGYDGLAADIVIRHNDVNIYGRIVTLVTPEVQFIALAGAPWERWESELQPIFETLLSSITFFTPVPVLAPTTTPTSVGQADTLRQWAASATASSQYADDDWSASQATGAPNVPECADDARAWASAGTDTLEWLEVSYDTPVTPIKVNIYETFNPGQIVKVELLDVNKVYHLIYTATARVKGCPSILSIDIPSANYQAVAVRITIDQAQINNWDEIDAVELVGYP
jgi:hypothetical protein